MTNRFYSIWIARSSIRRLSMKTSTKHFFAAMAVVVTGTVAVHATSLVPGSAISLSLEAEPAVGSVLLVSASVPLTALTFTGTLVSSVYSNDSSNPWGGLTFTYQLYNNGPDSVERLTLSSYAGFLTDVSYNGSGIVPLNAVRTTLGNQISFNFRNQLEQGTLISGASSSLLIIQTDSASYQNSIAGVINSSTANSATFAPKAVPEPTTVTLVMFGVVACFCGRRMRS